MTHPNDYACTLCRANDAARIMRLDYENALLKAELLAAANAMQAAVVRDALGRRIDALSLARAADRSFASVDAETRARQSDLPGAEQNNAACAMHARMMDRRANLNGPRK